MFCIVTVVGVHVLYCDSDMCTCFVLWQWYVYMFCVVTAVRVHVLCCASGTCTCFVLWQWYVYMFCVVTVVRVHVLYCDSGTCTCFVLWQWYLYIFVLWQRYVYMFSRASGRREKMPNTAIHKSLNRPLPRQCDMILSQPVKFLHTSANQTHSGYCRCTAINMSHSFPANSSKPRFICSCAVYRRHSLPFPCKVFVFLSNAVYISCLSITLECR